MRGGTPLSFYENIKDFIKKHSGKSNQLINFKSLKDFTQQRPLTIKYKFRIHASELSSDQSTINDIVNKIIRNDSSKRAFAGKTDSEIGHINGPIYQFESYRTQQVNLVPSGDKELDVYVEQIHLGSLPTEFYEDAIYHLQSTIFMAFAYVTGGPYKYFDEEKGRLVVDKEPFDLIIYVQFS